MMLSREEHQRRRAKHSRPKKSTNIAKTLIFRCSWVKRDLEVRFERDECPALNSAPGTAPEELDGGLETWTAPGGLGEDVERAGTPETACAPGTAPEELDGNLETRTAPGCLGEEVDFAGMPEACAPGTAPEKLEGGLRP